MKREIYSVAFNKHKEGDVSKMCVYTLGVTSFLNGVKTPSEIVVVKDRVVVTFTDGSRHHIPYTDEVEIFDREVKENKKG